jgi:uroporphyrinogen-III synthase
VGVTADRRAEEQCEMLQRRGARVVHAPAIRTLPLGPDDGLRAATEALLSAPPELLIANTGIGIRSWFAAAEGWDLGDELASALADVRVFARGPKAAGACLTAGLAVEWRAPSESLAEVVAKVLDEPAAGVRIAMQLDGNIEQHELERLRAGGADVVGVPVYRWTLPDDRKPAEQLVRTACAGRLDAVTFTSAAAVRNLFAVAEAIGEDDALRNALNGSVVAMCVGPLCAQVAADFGVVGLEPTRPRLGSMVRTLTDHLGARRRVLRVGRAEIVVQGSLVVVDGEHANLTDREGAVLEALLAQPGAVVSRSRLLQTVWGTRDADEHTLEVTVARLRRRLGAAGPAIQTVPRRGYRFDTDPRSN